MSPLLPLCCCLSLTVAGAATGRVEVLAGAGQPGSSGDGGPALAALLNQPFGLVRGPDGCLYCCEYEGAVIRKIDARGVITRVAGGGGQLLQPHEIRFDARGDLYVADTGHHRIARVDLATGALTTVAGTGVAGFSGDGGPASAATFKLPISLQFDPAGDLFVCDIGNHRIRRIDRQTGVITTFAGTGQRAPTPDGASYASAPLNGPRSVDCDAAGDLWVVLREGHQVLRLDRATGQAHLVAGTGRKGQTGNGGPAKLATLSGPKGLAVTPDARRLVLADTESSTIRVIDLTTGQIDRLCGTGQPGATVDADPLRCSLSRPHGIYLEPDGTVLVGDSYNHRILAVRPPA